jgi:hypothetical protein
MRRAVVSPYSRRPGAGSAGSDEVPQNDYEKITAAYVAIAVVPATIAGLVASSWIWFWGVAFGVFTPLGLLLILGWLWDPGRSANKLAYHHRAGALPRERVTNDEKRAQARLRLHAEAHAKAIAEAERARREEEERMVATEQLAQEFGLPNPSIAKWEAEERDRLKRIARELPEDP